jgi:hypothetical protein
MYLDEAKRLKELADMAEKEAADAAAALSKGNA